MPGKTYQLKITLSNTNPPVWRRIKIDGHATFEYLHDVIQRVMGWENGHLFEFKNKNYNIIPDAQENDFIEDGIDIEEITIEEVLKGKGSKIKYIYDFGDHWEHQILVEEIEKDNGVLLHGVICLDGKRNCPPEDCGGPWGYVRMIEVTKDPKNPEHEEIMEWLGENFDPEHFDLAETNQQMVESFSRR
jgi:hypothetical protein